MSQLSVNGRNFQTDDLSVDSMSESDEKMFSADFKEQYDKQTAPEKFEKLGGPTAPKPESTMHKVGRYLTGILGGLLLAAGVAAAVAATVATCGLAGGVIAGVAATVVGTVGGTAATAVIAGAAGSAGIALITGSHVMKPRNPEALLQTQQTAKQEITDEVQLTKIGPEEADTIAEALKSNHGIDVTEFNDTDNLYVKSLRDNGMGFLLKNNISLKGDDTYGTVSKYAKDNVVQFVSNALTVFGVDSEKAQSTPKNVLLVRYAIDNYLRTQSAILADDALNVLNNDAVKADLNKMLSDEMNEMPAQTESYHMLAIFRDALNLKSVPKPQQNPVEIGGDDMDDDLHVVSMGKQLKGPDLSKLPAEISFNPEAAQPIAQALKGAGVSNPIYNDICGDYFTNVLNFTTKKDDGTISSMGDPQPFVRMVLLENDININPVELNATNVLLVRNAIIKYAQLNTVAKTNDKYTSILEDLNTPEGRKPYVDYLQNALKNEKNADRIPALKIFIAALSETDLANLNPIPHQELKA